MLLWIPFQSAVPWIANTPTRCIDLSPDRFPTLNTKQSRPILTYSKALEAKITETCKEKSLIKNLSEYIMTARWMDEQVSVQRFRSEGFRLRRDTRWKRMEAVSGQTTSDACGSGLVEGGGFCLAFNEADDGFDPPQMRVYIAVMCALEVAGRPCGFFIGNRGLEPVGKIRGCLTVWFIGQS